MGNNLVPNGLSIVCPLFEIEISEIISQKADEPNAVVDRLETDICALGMVQATEMTRSRLSA